MHSRGAQAWHGRLTLSPNPVTPGGAARAQLPTVPPSLPPAARTRQAYFFTRDLSRSWRMAEALEYGMVGVNEVAITASVAPFGGVKQSGIGREQSAHALDEFQEVKYVCIGLNYERS